MLVKASLWYRRCNVAISGVHMERGGSLQLFPRSLTSYAFLRGSLSFSVPLFFLAGELGDVDQSPDSRNNREPNRKNDLLSRAAHGPGALRLMGYDVTFG